MIILDTHGNKFIKWVHVEQNVSAQRHKEHNHICMKEQKYTNRNKTDVNSWTTNMKEQKSVTEIIFKNKRNESFWIKEQIGTFGNNIDF
jgi:hypothetical protein